MIFLQTWAWWLLLLPLGLGWYVAEKHHFSKRTLWYFGVMVLLILGMARPVLPKNLHDEKEQGVDLILGLDLSYSMQANDIAPTRFEAAKESIKTFIHTTPNNRYAVVGFTTNALMLSPMSYDTYLLEHLFERLNPNQVITKGTDILSILHLSTKLSDSPHKELILFTDGGDETSWNEAITFAQNNHITVHILAIGTLNGSTLLTPQGQTLLDEGGQIVVTSLNSGIQTLAKATSGIYQELQGGSVVDFVHAVESSHTKLQERTLSKQTYTELFYIPVGAALVLFILLTTSLSHLLPFTGLLLLSTPLPSHASLWDFYYLKEAHYAYETKNYEQAISAYERIGEKNWESLYNLGVSYYKHGDYDKALVTFFKIKSVNPNIKATLYCAIANTYIRKKEFTHAGDYFKRSLILHYNLECDENYQAILTTPDPPQLLTGKQQSRQQKKDAQENSVEKTDKKNTKKSGGGSNMNVQAQAGADPSNKKSLQQNTQKEKQPPPKVDLSSKQYDLINERRVDEEKPW